MSTSQDAVIRVAVRAVVVAAIVGFLVLMFHGRAWAETPEDLALKLTSIDAAEQSPAARARALIRQDRRGRWLRIQDRFFETGIRAWTAGSPRRLISGVRDLASELWSLQSRTPSEDRALDLLEVDLTRDSDASRADQDLYSALRERELEDLLAQRLELARGALKHGYLTLALVQLERATELDANSEEALELLDRWALECEDGRVVPADSLADLLDSDWGGESEVSALAALLDEDYGRVRAHAAESPGGQYARAVALYLGGQQEAGLGLLTELGERNDSVGDLARSWVQREDVNLSATLDREARTYRVRHMLGLVGGRALADDGTAMSPEMIRAWRDSMTPMNMALSLPARLIRGWRPDGEALRKAAREYLREMPAGIRAEEAREWVETLTQTEEPETAMLTGVSSPRDGFRLPPAKTAYVKLSASPLLVTRGVLDSVYVSDAGALREAIGNGPAVVLEARRDVAPDQGVDPARARRLLSELAFALEEGRLDPMGGTGLAPTLEGIRRLERALRDGAVLVAEQAEFGTTEVWGTVTRAYIDGEYETVGALSFSRGSDEIKAARHFGGRSVRCPEATLCVDRTHAVKSTVFARVDTDSNLQLALAGEIGGARMSMSMIGSDGPRASLVLPVGRWLGVGSWLPVAAYVGVSGDSFYVGPTFSR